MNFIAYYTTKDKLYLVFGTIFIMFYLGRLVSQYMEQKYE